MIEELISKKLDFNKLHMFETNRNINRILELNNAMNRLLRKELKNHDDE